MNSIKVMSNMNKNFVNMPCHEIIEYLSISVDKLNDRRKQEVSLNLEDKKMMSDFEDSAIKLEQARRGL